MRGLNYRRKHRMYNIECVTFIVNSAFPMETLSLFHNNTEDGENKDNVIIIY